jgi:peroxiredoxin
MLDVGDTAPMFTAPGTDGEALRTYDIEEYVDEGALILAFYPFDFSPICTTELCEFRDIEWLTFTENVDLFGVSTDSAYAHRAFINEYDLTFPLLSDSTADICDQFGVRYDRWEDHGEVAKRAVFIVDDTRTIQYRWVTDNALEKPNLDNVRDAVDTVGVFS